jgi:hypothetical protein
MEVGTLSDAMTDRQVVLGQAPFRSDRYFQLWSYHVSTRSLLLRSTQTRGFSSRISVHFGGVTAMALRSEYHSLEIREAIPDETAAVTYRYGQRLPAGTLYVFGPVPASFVVSDVMQWHADDGEWPEPSIFGAHLR